MAVTVFSGVIAAIGIIFLLAKLNIKRVLCFDVVVDIVVTLGLTVLLAGTFAGMRAALLGGAIISMFLYMTKRLFGYEKPVWNRYWFTWVNLPPKGRA